jgi:hemerythrin
MDRIAVGGTFLESTSDHPPCLQEEIMDLVKWKKEYSIGVPKIDSQHKKIIGIVNQAMGLQFSDQNNNKEVEEVLDNLRNYFKEHFRTEEEYMLAHQYAGYELQRKEHSQFIDRLCEAEKEQYMNGRVTSINIFNFIWDWFSHHIIVLDKQITKIG